MKMVIVKIEGGVEARLETSAGKVLWARRSPSPPKSEYWEFWKDVMKAWEGREERVTRSEGKASQKE